MAQISSVRDPDAAADDHLAGDGQVRRESELEFHTFHLDEI
jgi:hypothetical protein